MVHKTSRVQLTCTLFKISEMIEQTSRLLPLHTILFITVKLKNKTAKTSGTDN